MVAIWQFNAVGSIHKWRQLVTHFLRFLTSPSSLSPILLKSLWYRVISPSGRSSLPPKWMMSFMDGPNTIFSVDILVYIWGNMSASATLPGPILKNKRGRESFSLRLIVHLSNFENPIFNPNYFISSDTYIFQYCYLYQHFHVNDYAFPYCRHYTSTLCSSFFIFHKKDIKFN